MNTKELRDIGENLFSRRAQLLNLWQEQAENFYPERADFTVKRYLGDDFAGNLMTSYPILCRRDLGDSIGTMLRDTRKPWFEMATEDPAREDNDAKAWLQWATGVQRRAMYDADAQFNKASKQGDHDFAAFGQCVIATRLNREGNTMLYRCYHLRDICWMEDEDGKICAIFRRWRPGARDLVRWFSPNGMRPKNKVHPNVARVAEKKPFEEIECMHIVVKADMFSGPDEGKPWRSIHYDCMNQCEMESIAQWTKEYGISRWETVSGSQYAYSPATVAALPDARLLQAMTVTLLQAGEKVVDPPLIATEMAVRSDMATYAGGVTWVDYEYDERLGSALRPMTIDAKGMPLSKDMQADCRNLLSQAFYLSKLRPFVPTSDPTMTAYQAGQIVAQYIRDALPLFEPMEDERNASICEDTFEVMKRSGAFGSPQSMPKSLQGASVKFRFSSSLHDAIESQKGQKFLEMSQLVAQAMALDKSVAALPDATVALRDALDGIQVPARWIRSEVVIEQMKADEAAKEQAQQALATMGAGADVAQTVGATIKDMSQAGLVPAGV